MRSRTYAVGARSWLAAALLMAAAIAPLTAPARAQGSGDPVAELIRKADAREADNGFCAGVTDWPPGTGEGYVQFLRNAAIGYAKVNRFRNNV